MPAKLIELSKITELGSRRAPRDRASSMDTVFLTHNEVAAWVVPPFQRPLRINAKVKAIADEMRDDGVAIKGVLTLGIINNTGPTYIVDGQHRIEAFRISGLGEVIADVRIIHFSSMAEMAEEFVELNSSLVRMKPDDILRGLEPTNGILQRLRAECRFVGYENIRRKDPRAPVLGMSITLRCWDASSGDTPAIGKDTAIAILDRLKDEPLDPLIQFLHIAYEAWGRDHAYQRLWASLNLSICMWTWRRMVLDKTRGGNRRHTILNAAQFKNCMMALSANADYCAWLQGRILGDRDRNPCYQRIKAIFSRRISSEFTRKVRFPQPPWANS